MKYYTRTLRRGDEGSDVRLLQQALQEWKDGAPGTDSGGFPITVDGDFGPKTKAAVLTFQRTSKLHPDGVVGANTWAALGFEPAPEYGYDVGMAAAKQVSVSRSSSLYRAAEVHNRYGTYLADKAKQYGIDADICAAVLLVESGGEGFSGERPIIRFENHCLYDYWGKQNTALFHQHFKYDNRKRWTGHKWRRDPSGSWQSFHGYQSKEWEVLEFARQLAGDSALLCASYGLGQVMGFNHKNAGFASAKELFDAMHVGLREQMDAMFTWIENKGLIDELRVRDFYRFAYVYNGSGKAKDYADKLEKAAFKYSRVTS